MPLKKDNIKDYAIEAFRFYVKKGRPTYESLRDEIVKMADHEAKEELVGSSGRIAKPTEYAVFKREQALQRHEAELLDILAVNKVIAMLNINETGKRILDAVEAIYFVHPNRDFERGEVSCLVIKAGQERLFCSEKTVYRYLKEARQLFAYERGLRVNE